MTYYLNFFMLLFLSMLKTKNLNTMVRKKNQIKVIMLNLK